MSRIRRWLHLLRHFPSHRPITAYNGFNGPVVLIACDCGLIFWKKEGRVWGRGEAEQFIRYRRRPQKGDLE